MALRGPSRINPVTVLLLCLVAGGGYLGWKLVPVYWRAQKVDQVLDTFRYRAAELDSMHGADQADKIIQEATDQILDLGGIDRRYLEVYFDPDYGHLRADYTVFVHLVLGKTLALSFSRSVAIPRDDD